MRPSPSRSHQSSLSGIVTVVTVYLAFIYMLKLQNALNQLIPFAGVGKTSIIYRHRFGDKFIQFNATIGASFVSHNVYVSIDPTPSQTIF